MWLFGWVELVYVFVSGSSFLEDFYIQKSNKTGLIYLGAICYEMINNSSEKEPKPYLVYREHFLDRFCM